MPTWLIFIMAIHAAYRLTRLVVWDQFPPILKIRTVVAGSSDGRVPAAGWSPHWLQELVTCPWCASGWISLGVTICLALTSDLPLPGLWWFAIWGGAALVLHYEATHTPDVSA